MRTDLRDTTFIIAVRLDSIARLENTLVVVSQLFRHFDTNVFVAEIADHCNGILKTLLPRKTDYLFVEDKDNVFYRTKYFNRMISAVETPLVALWDTDVVVDKRAIVECADRLRSGEAEVAYPYNGTFLETSGIVRRHYMKTKDVRVLHRNRAKLDLLYNITMTGGAVIVDREKYVAAGMENEAYYGWGNEDYDRYFRARELGYRIHRVDTPLFHLYHPRGDNSRFRSDLLKKISDDELNRMTDSSKEEIEDRVSPRGE